MNLLLFFVFLIAIGNARRGIYQDRSPPKPIYGLVQAEQKQKITHSAKKIFPPPLEYVGKYIFVSNPNNYGTPPQNLETCCTKFLPICESQNSFGFLEDGLVLANYDEKSEFICQEEEGSFEKTIDKHTEKKKYVDIVEDKDLTEYDNSDSQLPERTQTVMVDYSSIMPKLLESSKEILEAAHKLEELKKRDIIGKKKNKKIKLQFLQSHNKLKTKDPESMLICKERNIPNGGNIIEIEKGAEIRIRSRQNPKCKGKLKLISNYLPDYVKTPWEGQVEEENKDGKNQKKIIKKKIGKMKAKKISQTKRFLNDKHTKIKNRSVKD